MLVDVFSGMQIHAHDLKRGWVVGKSGGGRNQNMVDCRETFSQLVHIPSVFSLIIPWCNETRGCQSDAAYPELCPSRREALNEKVTSHPPVKEQMPHQSNAWQWEQVLVLGAQDELGIGAGMAIKLTHMNSQTLGYNANTHTHKDTRARCLTPLPRNERHGQRIETEPFPGMITLATQKPRLLMLHKGRSCCHGTSLIQDWTFNQTRRYLSNRTLLWLLSGENKCLRIFILCGLFFCIYTVYTHRYMQEHEWTSTHT